VSSEYRVWAEVTVATREEAWAVEEALEDFWPFDLKHDEIRALQIWDGQLHTFEVRGHGDGSIGAGWSPEQLAIDLKRLVWKTLQRYVDVTVRARCLEPDEAWGSNDLEFALARDGGLLCRDCDDCGDPLPFGATGKQCQGCHDRDQAEDGSHA